MTDERSAEQASDRLSRSAGQSTDKHSRSGKQPVGRLARVDSAGPLSPDHAPDQIRRADPADPVTCDRAPDAVTRTDPAYSMSPDHAPDVIRRTNPAHPLSPDHAPDVIRRMHTAEHVLTAVMRRLHGSPRNLEFHLGDKKTKCDYEVVRPLAAEDARSIEDAVNAEIRRDHPVSVMQITRGDAQHLDLWKVPPDAETIRVVQIGDIDETPCSGEHVQRTGEIGRFVLKSYEMRTPTVVRIRFGVEA